MSETSFPIKDLTRRKFQTTLIVTTLTLCVASTVFLLLLADRVGFGISSTVEGRTTVGFSAVFSSFILIIGILTFVIGGVIVSFIAFVMMSQRVRDIGLMKAIGCPNDLIFAHFTTELLIVTLSSGVLGVVLGIAATFASNSLFNGSGFQLAQQSINLWLVLLVFAFFLILMLAFGIKPILDTTKLEPAKAISPTYHIGLVNEPRFKVISKSGFSMKVAIRNLFRHRSATIRIILCLATVFVLVTIAVGGGIIADQTSKSWIEEAIGKNMVLIANQEMCNQYQMLLSKFYKENESMAFNYTQQKYLIPGSLTNASYLGNITGISVDARLITQADVTVLPGIAFDQSTGEPAYVGSLKHGESIIIGVQPGKMLNNWFLEGTSLEANTTTAVIGDSMAQEMFSEPFNQSMIVFNKGFQIVGVCIDPLNNGNVTYVPLPVLQDAINEPNQTNIVLVKIDSSANYEQILNQIRTEVNKFNSNFNSNLDVLELNGVLDKSLSFLDSIWSTVMFLPLFSIVAALLCSADYIMLVTNEQRQEFGVLRAVGANPRGIVKIISGQSLIILLLCYAVGITVGIIVTWQFLIPEPLVTISTVAEIAGWLLIILAVTLAFNLYPAIKFAKKPIPEILT